MWREDIQFVDSSGETTVTQSSDHTTTLGNPGVTSSNSDSTDTQQAEVTFEFLLVTGGVDHFTLVAVGVLSGQLGRGLRLLIIFVRHDDGSTGARLPEAIKG